MTLKLLSVPSGRPCLLRTGAVFCFLSTAYLASTGFAYANPCCQSNRAAIAYICNPDKTDGNLLISSYGCSPETAHFDFKFALSKTSQNDENKTYHLIQSFLPGEVDFDTARQIGMELADKVLEGKYSYVVSTHIDRDHIHNHIIFCGQMATL